MSGLPPTGRDRLMDAIRSLIRQEIVAFTYAGVWEYAVQAISSDGTTADVRPTDASIPIGPLASVPLLAGMLGEQVSLTLGSKVRVAFLNCDPTRPVIIGTDTGAAFAQLGGGTFGSGSALGRVGDSVSVTFDSTAASHLTCVNGAPPTVTPPTGFQLTGTITSGSTKVSSG